MKQGAVADSRHLHSKRRRTLISCTECHRRKQRCDRCRPCQNCVKRGKLELCRYETSDDRTCDRVIANASSTSTSGSGTRPSTCADPQSLSEPNRLSPQDHRHLVGVLGYSTHNVHNTFSLANKVGATELAEPSSHGFANIPYRKQAVLHDRYRSLVRQLPSREYVDFLVQRFFSEVNWQYDVLDEITFHRQLESWRRLPYSTHSQEIASLPAEIFALPSIVFQLMSHALLHQPVDDRTGPSLEPLKYASEMTFADLAHEFSEAGYSLIESIEKEDVSVVAVQSGILRASFLKNTGSVVDAWHVVGTTIRNAQELGLHAGIISQDPLISIDAQWDYEMRRRVWFVLHNWDVHMAVVLGRPIATIMVAETVELPDDPVRREGGKPPRERTDQDTPTPFSVIRVGYDVAYRYFLRVREIENHGARTADYHVVQETHAAVMGKIDRIPRWCRHDDPDVHFDEIPSCHWLPAARQSLMSGIYFVLLSLHRPYIFSVSESRMEALKAALMIFTAQRRLFELSEPKQYLSFNMIYPLFDAMIISLAILVLFPNENRDMHSLLNESVYWGVDILTKIGQYNTMARSANSVVKMLLSRLEEGRRRSSQQSNHNSEEGVTQHAVSQMADLRTLETGVAMGSTTDNLAASNLAEPLNHSDHQTRPTASTPSDLDVETLLPPRPVGDLFYQGIYTPVPDTLQGAEFSTEFLQFDGNHADDSFWSFINDLGHA